MGTIYIDGDACSVKKETYRVAVRRGWPVRIVANHYIQTPPARTIIAITVGKGADVADDWIAERARPGAIVVTADVPLASRCVKAGADVLAPTGKPFSESGIGMALATRNLMQDLREAGAITGGPKPFSARDRSAFLGALDRTVMRLKRGGFG